jgi:hypothetical protein
MTVMSGSSSMPCASQKKLISGRLYAPHYGGAIKNALLRNRPIRPQLGALESGELQWSEVCWRWRF